jgi:hypothetical protein
VSDEQEFGAGTVDIEVIVDEVGYDEFFPTTLDMSNMEPGDCKTQVIRVHNKGTLPVDLWNWIYAWGDLSNCDPNPNCNLSVTKSLVADNTPPEDKLHHQSDWEDWELKACLPLCAGNLCQGKTGKMRIFFHAVQQSNLEVGWNCVKLLHKEAPDWIPDPTWTPNASGIPAHGNKCYEDEVGTGPDVDFVVNGYNMTANMPLQIMLNGPGGVHN